MCSPGLIVADDDNHYAAAGRMRKRSVQPDHVIMDHHSSCSNCKTLVQLPATALVSRRSSELQLCNIKIASSTPTLSCLVIILVWLLRIIGFLVGFLLSMAKCFLVWFCTRFLPWCLQYAIQEGSFFLRRYVLGAAAFLISSVMAATTSRAAAPAPASAFRLTYYNVDEVNSSAERWNPAPATTRRRTADHQNHQYKRPMQKKKPASYSSVHGSSAIPRRESPLLPVVLEDIRKSFCDDNSDQLEDRERLVYEYSKIVAPQVSAFQLGEIVVPLRDTRQLATFLKSKLTEACKWQPISSDDFIAAICDSILNLGLYSSSQHKNENINEYDISASTASDLAADVDAAPPSSTSTTTASSLVELSAGAAWSCNQAVAVQHAMIYMAAATAAGRLHLVLVGHKVDDFSGSSEFRSRYNPPATQSDKREWQVWNSAHLRALKESVVETAQQLLTVTPIPAQVW